MAHGYPDYGVTSAIKTVHPVRDMGELAARLWSPVTFDRRGDVVFLESFEDGLNRVATGAEGVGASVGLSTITARSGGYSVKVVTSADTAQCGWIAKNQPLTQLVRVGAEASICIPAGDAVFVSWSRYESGAKRHIAGVRYNTALGRIEFYNAAGGWTVLLDYAFPYKDLSTFHTTKLVMNLEKEEYTRILLNALVIDMRGVPYYTLPNAEVPCWYTFLRVYPAVVSPVTVYLDDLILTQNEP